jgi:hypothetical protein
MYFKPLRRSINQRKARLLKNSLMKHKPWVDDPKTLWEDIEGEPSDECLVQLWKQFCEDLEKSGEQIPDVLRRDIDQVKAFVSEHTEQEELLGGSEGMDDDDDGAELEEWVDNNFRLENDVEDPDDDDIEWSLDHDFVNGHVCEYQRPSINVPRSHKRSIFMNMRTVSTEMVAVPRSDAKLNFLQECAHDAIVYLSELDPADTFSKCMLLTGKGGTGKTTTINMVTRTLEQRHHIGCVRKLATTGKAADLIGGYTVHDTRRGLALPVGSKQSKPLDPLDGQRLKDLQREWNGTIAVIIDEYSMLRQKELYWIDQRLRQIMVGKDNVQFGGLSVILSGDPGQIPPVQGRCL